MIRVASHAAALNNHLRRWCPAHSHEPARIGIALMALLLACCSHTAFATSKARVVRRAADELVTLTVTSSCGSASIKVKKHVVLTTPFNVTFPRGKTIQLKALDASVPQCGGLTVVSPFKQFIVNQTVMPEGERSITLTLDQDTAVLVQYGTLVSTPVTLSVLSNCTAGANILVTETTIGGQSGTLRTHFDGQFMQGQPLRLEAPASLAACLQLGVVLYFVNWSAGGKAYPQNQTAIDLTLTGFTSAYAHYTGVFPTLRINSYQLLHNGVQANYVRVGEDFNEFTLLLTGEPFPPEVNVFVIGGQAEQAEILSRASPTEIEIRLPPRRAVAPGFSFVRVTSPDSRFSNSVPIEIRRE
jgi:hypothetical protein